ALNSFKGKTIWSKRLRANVKANRSATLLEVPQNILNGIDRSNYYLTARIQSGGKMIAENRFFFIEPKHLALPNLFVRHRLETGIEGEYLLTVSSTGFAKNVRIEVEGEDAVFDDNYFDLDANIPKIVRFCSLTPLGELRKKIRIHSYRGAVTPVKELKPAQVLR
ncbi:MAG TPA: glycoside hydrolase family 2 protein, partial [Bacteroidota bacterium]|nr:glycoside hydrolase family 2 protein [Bacteroidota bacterium]